VARNLMRTTFVSKRLTDKLARRPDDVPKSRVSRLGVIGASALATDIVQRAAHAGIPVAQSQGGGALARQDDAAAGLAQCDLIILAQSAHGLPAATVLAAAEAVAAPHAVIASAMRVSIADLARTSKRPRQLIGVGFQAARGDPPLVEIVRGGETSREAVARAMDFAAQLRITPIVVKDAPGFYTDRIRAAFVGEGMRMLEEGVDPSLVQRAADRAGMPSAFTSGAHDASARRAPRSGEQPDVAELKQRLLYIAALEGARCLEEGIVSHPADADLGAVFGVGFPKWTGGPLSYIETVGLDAFVAQCARMARRHGARYRPPPALIERAHRGATFYAATEDP
jgi:3-hydroxyacyl-CoA dehydrogenase / enoyl-CoA hydratase / 3-hydroxybutyryl-CoA epimerase